MGSTTKSLVPLLFLTGYLLLALLGGWAGTLLGSLFAGFADGAGIPYIMSEASMKAGKAAATTVMPLISAALYLAQFLSPVLTSMVTAVFGGAASQLPYCCFTIVLSILFVFWSALIPTGKAKRAGFTPSTRAKREPPGPKKPRGMFSLCSGSERERGPFSLRIWRWDRPAQCAHPGSGRPGTGRRCSGRGRPCCAPHSGRRPGRRRPCCLP